MLSVISMSDIVRFPAMFSPADRNVPSKYFRYVPPDISGHDMYPICDANFEFAALPS